MRFYCTFVYKPQVGIRQLVAETDAIYREAVARYHRTLAHYFAVYAWAKKVDCIYVYRTQIMKLLKLKKLTRKRIHWFEEDVRPWFPNMKTMWLSDDNDKLGGIILSRKEIPRESLLESASGIQRVKLLCENGLQTISFLDGIPANSANSIDENCVVSNMSLVSAGLVLLDDLPGVRTASV